MGNVDNDNLERSLVKVNGTMKNFGDTVSSAIDQITHMSEKASSSLRQIGDTADRVSNAVGSVRDIAELYTQCVEINAHTRQVEAITQLKLAQTVAKFKLGELFLIQSFGERNGAYSIITKCLTKLLKKEIHL